MSEHRFVILSYPWAIAPRMPNGESVESPKCITRFNLKSHSAPVAHPSFNLQDA
jgi:hypothetical protein